MRNGRSARSLRAARVRGWFVFFVVMALLCCSSKTWGQGAGVEGVVLDPASASVVGVQVTLVNEEGGEPQHTVTNNSGYYHFVSVAPGRYTVRVESAGFEPFESKHVVVSAGTMQHANAQLQLGRDAQEVRVVSATGQEQEVQDAPASISLITQQDIETRPVYNVGDLLMQSPGVTGNLGATNSLNKITMRGMDSQYTLILVDGKRMGSSSSAHYRSDLGYQDLNWISPQMIDHIEIIRGPMSTLYGSDAMGGMINIITKKIADKWRFSANADYTGSTDSERGDATTESVVASGPVGKRLNLRGNYSFSQQNPDKVVVGSSYTNGRSGERNQSGLLSGVFVVNSRHSLDFEGTIGHQESEAPETPGSTGDAQSAYGANDLWRNSWSVGYNGNLGPVGKSAVHLYRTAYNNKISGSTLKNADLILDATLDTLIEHGWLGAHFIRSGGQYHRMDLTNTLNVGTAPILPDGTVVKGASLNGYTGALFSEDTVQVRPNLLLTFGGRWDHDYKFGDSFEPRGYVVFHPKRELTVRGGVSRGFRAPSLTESAPASATKSGGGGCSSLAAYGYKSGGCYIIGNPDLKPETTVSYEGGAGYAHRGIQIDGTFFWTDFKNKIQNVPLGYYNKYWFMQKQNVEKARTKGLEFSTVVPVTRYVKIRSNWTWMLEAKNLTTGDMLITTPEVSGWNAVDVTPIKRLNLQYSVQFTGKQLLTSTGSVDGRASNAIVNSYNITNVAANYRIWGQSRLRAGINNLYQTQVDATTGYSYYQPRRQYFFGIVTNF